MPRRALGHHWMTEARRQMLVRIWRNPKAPTALVGTFNGASTLGTGLAAPQTEAVPNPEMPLHPGSRVPGSEFSVFCTSA